MTTTQVRVERRASQRFEFQLPVGIGVSERNGNGFTQDLSGRGVSFITDMNLLAGDAIELTLMMPSEITLGESMRVRCRGQVKRVLGLDVACKSLVAVHFDGYEYLPVQNAAKASYAETNEAGVSLHTFDWRSAANLAHR